MNEIAKNTDEIELLHMNVPQLLCHAVQAQHNMLLWGRGTGKTEGALALFSLTNILAMPQGNGAIVGTTYEQILTRTLPPLIAGWAKMDYHQDVHFFIRRLPPPKWEWKKAHRHPLTPEHYISWFNGSGIYLVSQDRSGTSNGLSVDWVIGDEAKFLNHEQLKTELLLTLRGNSNHFGHLSCHLSTMFASDKSRNPTARWMQDIRKEADEDKINLILQTVKFITKNPHKAEQYAESLNFLRKGLTYYSEASTLDNVHALGLEAIKGFQRNLSVSEFRLSVLNEDVTDIDGAFYSAFDELEHTYERPNYEYIDSLPTQSGKKDCRWDMDINNNSPLYFACDYNAAISCLVVGQNINDNIQVINNLYVGAKQVLKDLATAFHNYYKYLPTRIVYYIYDHTAIAKSPADQQDFSDDIVNALKELGWDCRRTYIGATPSHGYRYVLMNDLFGGKLPTRVSINRANCQELIFAMEAAPVKQGKTGFEKDKSSERSKVIPQVEATHLTDAFDILVCGLMGKKAKKSTAPAGNI